MCGIAGYFLKKTIRSANAIEPLLKSIRQRGPDDEGVCLVSRNDRTCWHFRTGRTATGVKPALPHIDDKQSIIAHDLSLLHVRYSIIDLSSAAHQPFVSRDGSLVGVFNGEIYNYIELRDELTAYGVSFRSSSDTEVLVEGYRFWGEDLWAKMNGFWAVAIYDFKNDEIVLSRDRIGVAPLYYRETDDGLYFASAIQSLIDINPSGIEVDMDVVLGFAQTGIKDHSNTTFYRQIRTLPASSTTIFRGNVCRFSGGANRKYWDFPKTRLTVSDISLKEAIQKYRELFFNAVELRLRADVKVAFELSGGLDSSSVVAAAAQLRSNRVTTYTAKIDGADEEPYARSILKRYPVDYRIIHHAEKGFAKDYLAFSNIMEEPYDNPNAYTHHKMLNEMKKEGVSVVVTGAGGDEILAGYESSFWPKAYHELRENGFFMHADIYEFLRRFKTIDSSVKMLRHYFFDLPSYVMRRVRSQIPDIGIPHESTSAWVQRRQYDQLTFHEQSLYHFKVALVPFYMRSSDHFTMAIPIEHRFPFLDFRMVELCLQMPVNYLLKNGWTKYLLRKAMEPYLPKKIIWRRKKMGFKFPYAMFFTSYRNDFEPILKYLHSFDIFSRNFESYDQLLKENPVLLWRLLSIAIWFRNQPSGMLAK